MRTRRIVRTGITALLWLVLSAWLALSAGRLLRGYTGVSVRIADTPVSRRALTTALAETGDELRLVAAWSRGETANVAAERMETTEKARPVAVYGDMRAVCPMRLLSGSYPVENDETGCLVTADVAMALFHSVDPADARLIVDGERYEVRGVVSAYEPMVLVRSDAVRYENLEFEVAALSGGDAAVGAFLYRHGLSGEFVAVQSGLYARMLFGVACLPGVLALLFAAAGLFRAWKRRGKRLTSLPYLLGAALALVLALFLLRRTFYWPQAYLPTKCADFGYWETLAGNLRESWKAMTLIVPLPKDVQFYAAARQVLCGALAALLLTCGCNESVCSLLREDETTKIGGSR